MDQKKETKKFMRMVTKTLNDKGLSSQVDSAALNMLERNYNTYLIAEDQLNKDGLVIMNKQGNLVAHPCVKISKDSQIQAVNLMREFGLTSLSRKKFDDNLGKGQNNPSGLEDFFQSMKNKNETR